MSMTSISLRSFFLCVMFATGLIAAQRVQAEGAAQPITVYAGSSMTDVLQTLAKSYKAASGKDVRFSFASSSVLARQIEAGAPADLFISADNDWMDYLANRNAIDAHSRRNLVSNRLVLIAPSSSTVTLQLVPGVDIVGALGAKGRLAMADPEYVPAGRYARVALIRFGVWNSVEPRLARAENVRAAMAFVARAEAPLGIVYQSDAHVEPRVRTVGVFPADSHPTIVYPAALTRTAQADARAFLDYISRPEAVATYVQFGFVAL